MASPQITVRLDSEVYKTLVKLAQVERKNLAELTRELIEQGLGKHQSIETEVLDRLNSMSAELAELIARAVKLSGQASYYASLSCANAEETAHYVTTAIAGGQVLDAQTKSERAKGRRSKARQIAEECLTKPFADV